MHPREQDEKYQTQLFSWIPSAQSQTGGGSVRDRTTPLKRKWLQAGTEDWVWILGATLSVAAGKAIAGLSSHQDHSQAHSGQKLLN
ncbi:unnamed protein product [Caretta caretta]